MMEPSTTGSSCGQRLIPSIIDEYSEQWPDKLYALLLPFNSEKIVTRAITFAQLGRAINRCALWLESCCGKGVNFETIAYLSRSDLGTSILIVAAIKVGFKVYMLTCSVWIGRTDKASFSYCLLATILKRIWICLRRRILSASLPHKSSRVWPTMYSTIDIHDMKLHLISTYGSMTSLLPDTTTMQALRRPLFNHSLSYKRRARQACPSLL